MNIVVKQTYNQLIHIKSIDYNQTAFSFNLSWLYCIETF